MKTVKIDNTTWSLVDEPLENFKDLKTPYSLFLKKQPKSWDGFQEYINSVESKESYTDMRFQDIDFPEIEFNFKTINVTISGTSGLRGSIKKLILKDNINVSNIRNCEQIEFNCNIKIKPNEPINIPDSCKSISFNNTDEWESFQDINISKRKLAVFNLTGSSIKSLKGIDNMAIEYLIIKAIDLQEGFLYCLLVKGLRFVDIINDDAKAQQLSRILTRTVASGKHGWVEVFRLFNELMSTGYGEYVKL